MHIKLEAVGYN